jgi:hypothetical protein
MSKVATAIPEHKGDVEIGCFQWSASSPWNFVVLGIGGGKQHSTALKWIWPDELENNPWMHKWTWYGIFRKQVWVRECWRSLDIYIIVIFEIFMCFSLRFRKPILREYCFDQSFFF